MRELRAKLTRRYPVPVYQWIAVWAGMIAFTAVAVVGIFLWVGNQRRETAENVAEVAYIAATSDYQNDHARWEDCLNAVDVRANNRANWHALYDAFEREFGPDAKPIVDMLRADFDRRTPALDESQCGREPSPPPLPAILAG